MRIALISGTGLSQLGGAALVHTADTPYGSALYQLLPAGPHELVLLPRHGPGHKVPPHKINYRANIWALKALDCSLVLATNAVGSLRPEMQVGELVLPDQFLDQTRQRALTFFDGEDGTVVHTDMTEPYCPQLRMALLHKLSETPLAVHPAATYLCTEGPRFETPAEIRAYAQWGADLVGMTGVPEVVLARELDLCYATVCIVTNMAAGLAPGHLDEMDIVAVARESFDTVAHALLALAAALPEPWTCDC